MTGLLTVTLSLILPDFHLRGALLPTPVILSIPMCISAPSVVRTRAAPDARCFFKSDMYFDVVGC